MDMTRYLEQPDSNGAPPAKRARIIAVVVALVAPGLTTAQTHAQSAYTPYTFTTLAGMAGDTGSANGTNGAARFLYPQGLAVDDTGNVYVADSSNHTLRKVTAAGVVTTLAGLAGNPGSADGTNGAARFSYPQGIAVSTNGSLFVADCGNHTIRKVTPVGTNWVVTTLAGLAGITGGADGTNSGARFYYPLGVALDGPGNLYVGDQRNYTIRKVAPVGTNWVVTTLAGLTGSWGSADGTNATARFNLPSGVAVDSHGLVYVADFYANNTIRKLAPVGTNWVVTTLAGAPGVIGSADGTNGAAQFHFPLGVAVDRAGNLYVGDQGNNTIRKLTALGTNWVATTLAGTVGNAGGADGTGNAASFNGPGYVAVDGAGSLYVSDNGNSTIRKGIPTNAVPPLVLETPSVKTGQLGFGILGLPGLAINVQVSPDLFNWSLLGPYILEGGSNYVVIPNPSKRAQFYRGQVR